jgi:hypothetical protein
VLEEGGAVVADFLSLLGHPRCQGEAFLHGQLLGDAEQINGPGLASNAVITIQLDGSQAGPDRSGLVFTSANNTLKGLSITAFLEAGAQFFGTGGNIIQGNSISGNHEGNLAIQSGENNLIGGLSAAARNFFATIGIASDNNRVQGNITNGIGISGTGNTIGGATAEARNIFSGNIKYGAGDYLPTNCPACKEMMTRREIIRARIRGQSVQDVSFDCDGCGRARFFVGEVGACSFCGEAP